MAPRRSLAALVDHGKRMISGLGAGEGTAIGMGLVADAQAAYNDMMRRQVMNMMNSTINPLTIASLGNGAADCSTFDNPMTAGAIFSGGSSQTPRPAPEPRRAAPQVTVRITQAANGKVVDLAATSGKTITWLVPDGEPMGANIDAALAVLKLEGLT